MPIRPPSLRPFAPARRAALILAGSIAALLGSPSAQAAVKTWSPTATTGSWNTGPNWGGLVPAAMNDSLVFGTQTGGATALTVDATTWGSATVGQGANFLTGITFNAGASAFTITLTNPLSFSSAANITSSAANDEIFTGGTMYMGIGTGGANVSFNSSGTGGLSIGSDLANGANANNAITLTGTSVSTNNIVSGVISGMNNGITKSGAGTWTLSGLNTYTGPTTVSLGTLIVSGNSAGSVSSFHG